MKKTERIYIVATPEQKALAKKLSKELIGNGSITGFFEYALNYFEKKVKKNG